MKNTVKWASLFLILVLAISVFGCGSSPSPTVSSTAGTTATTTAPAATSSETTSTTAAPATESTPTPVPKPEYYQPKILINMAIDPSIVLSNENEVGKVLEEKFNIVFEYIPLTGDFNEKANLLLATGDYPEMIGMTGMDNIRKYIDAGAAISLEEYIKDAPNFQEAYKDQIPLWRGYSSKNAVSHWENGVGGDVSSKVAPMPGDIMVRSDALEKQGWPKLDKASDWVAFLKQAMIDFPETNGKISIGMTTTFGEPWGLQGIAAIGYEKGADMTGWAGNNAVIWNHTESKFVDYFLNPTSIETIKWFNTLYREGILDIECFTDLYQQTVDKVKSGQAIAIWYSGWASGEANLAFIEAGKPEMAYTGLPFQLDSQAASNQKRNYGISLTNFSDIYCITKNAKQPERLFDLVEWCCSEEGQILLQGGVEGKTYTIVDGKRAATAEYIKNWSSFEWKKPHGIAWSFRFLPFLAGKGSDGINFDLSTPEIIASLMNDRDRLIYDKMNLSAWLPRLAFVPIDADATTITLDSTSELSRVQTKLIDFRVKAYAKLIMAKTEAEYDSTWEKLKAEYLKLNPETVIAEYNAVYAARKAAK